MGAFAKTGTASNAADRFDNLSAGINNVATLVTGAACNIYRLVLENNDVTNAVFFQFFDAATAGAVTVGTTVPKLTLRVPAGGSVLFDPLDFPILHCYLGLVIAATTTRLGSTIPTTLPNCGIWYIQGQY